MATTMHQKALGAAGACLLAMLAAATVLSPGPALAEVGSEAATKPVETPPAAPVAAENAGRPLLPAPLVHLRDVEPSIIQDIRYAGSDNFTGAPVPGYAAPECILTRRTAEALARVQSALKPRSLSLKVYDCYRPERAVAAFVAWSEARGASPSRFHPSLARSQLFPAGYIAARSGHSRGHVVDLTLVALPRAEAQPFNAGQPYGACTGQLAQRSPDDGLDMGTGFDCFDALSHAGAAGLSPGQAQNRRILTAAMRAGGFVPYAREWWHFSLPAGDPGRSFDIPVIAPRR